MSDVLDRAAWLARRRTKRKVRRWTKPEMAQLRAMIGKRTVKQMADHFGRPFPQMLHKLNMLGYSIPTDVTAPLGCTAIELARRMGIPYEVVWGAVRRGEIKAVKQHKKDYLIRWPEVRKYEKWLRTLIARRERALARIKEPTITKQAFMKLLGLSETHGQRYLAGGIVKAWKIPCHWRDAAHHRWEWHVSEADAERVKRLREAGKLRFRRKAYRELIRRNTEQINILRRARRLGKRDDLKHTLSPVIPGHYTVAQLASHLGLSGEAIYRHIRLGRLEVKSIRVGSRNYLAIPPEVVPAYRRWAKREKVHTGPLRAHQCQIERVHAAGLLTIPDAAEKYGLNAGTLRAAVCDGRVKSRKIGGMRGLREVDVEAYKAVVRMRGKQRRRVTP